MTFPVPIWIVGALAGGLFGLVQGLFIRQMLIKTAVTAGKNVPALARFIVPMEAVAFGLVGGVIANQWFGEAI